MRYRIIRKSNQRNAQGQVTSAGLNLGGCVDSTEIVISYYIEISTNPYCKHLVPIRIYATNIPLTYKHFYAMITQINLYGSDYTIVISPHAAGQYGQRPIE